MKTFVRSAILGFVLWCVAVTFYGLGYVFADWLLPHARAQEANETISATANPTKAVVPMQAAPAATDPGTEGEVRITVHKVFTYHKGGRGWSPRFPMPATNQPTTDTDTNTP